MPENTKFTIKSSRMINVDVAVTKKHGPGVMVDPAEY